MKQVRKILLMDEHVCPWWLAYTFDNPLRRILHQPEKLLKPFVKEGDVVVDIGCGMGFFSIGMAKMVGETGKVISVDLQAEMLAVVHQRAGKNGVAERIQFHRAGKDSIGISGPVDFALAFWMVHEVPDPANFLAQVRAALKPEAHFFYAEPKVHVTRSRFEQIVALAHEAGMKTHSYPKVTFSRAVVFTP